MSESPDLPIEDESAAPATGDGALLSKTHYSKDGKSVVRVSAVLDYALRDEGLETLKRTMPSRLDAAAAEGTARHALAAWYLRYRESAAAKALLKNGDAPDDGRGPVALSGLTLERLQWLRRFARWTAENVAEVLAVEKFVSWEGKHRGVPGRVAFGGTVDAVLLLRDGDLYVADWKTGMPSRRHRIQTAAYAVAWCSTAGAKHSTRRRLVLYCGRDLKKWEMAILAPATLAPDVAVWNAALTCYAWGAA